MPGSYSSSLAFLQYFAVQCINRFTLDNKAGHGDG